MSIFNTILQRLGIEKAAPEPAQTAPLKPTATQMPDNVFAGTSGTASAPGAASVTPPVAPPVVPPAASPAAPHVVPSVSLSSDPRLAGGLGASPVPDIIVAMKMVDVVSKLDKMAAAYPAKLAWKVSIVDLLKLLDVESSYDARKELAIELGCPAENLTDSARMNIWLHKTVLQKISENGGNIPKELLD